MACSLLHSVEEMQAFVQKQCEQDDAARQKAIVEVINMFEHAKAKKEQLRKKYAKCKDISPERQAVIDKFLSDEASKDDTISETLWKCVSHIQDNITNKIRCSYEENKIVGSVSQQLNQLGLGASTSADAHGFIEQQHYQFTSYEDEAVDEHCLTARQHYEIMCGEQALREVEAEQARIQQEWEERLTKEEVETAAYRLEFGYVESPEYDSAYGEHSD